MPILDPTQRAVPPTRRPPTRPSSGGSRAAGDSHADATHAHNAYVDATNQASDQASILELDALLKQLDDTLSGARTEARAQGADIDRTLGLQVDDSKRTARIQGAHTRRGMASRGLALSGVRAAAENRNRQDLTRRLGFLQGDAASRKDAVQRALERTEKDIANQKTTTESKKRLFGG